MRSMNLINISREIGSTPVMVQMSRVAKLEDWSFRPLIAEQMQEAAISDGGVWIRDGSVTKKIFIFFAPAYTHVYLTFLLKNNSLLQERMTYY